MIYEKAKRTNPPAGRDRGSAEARLEALQRAREKERSGTKAHKRISTKIRRLRLKIAREKGRHTEAEWLALKALGVCVRCRVPTAELVKDHIIPIYAGGSDGVENIQPLCKKYNSSKGPETTNHLKAFIRAMQKAKKSGK